MSALDIKAAFNNIPLPSELKRFCGVVTQDGLFVYRVMAWGFNAAPCHYQTTMCSIMRAPHPHVPVPWHALYLDDVTAAGASLAETWEATLASLWRVALSGQPINLWKCHFMCERLPLLGVTLMDSHYTIGAKAVAKLLEIELPRTLK